MKSKTLHTRIDEKRVQKLNEIITNTNLKNTTDVIKKAIDIAYLTYKMKELDKIHDFFKVNTLNLTDSSFNTTKIMPEEALK